MGQEDADGVPVTFGENAEYALAHIGAVARVDEPHVSAADIVNADIDRRGYVVAVPGKMDEFVHDGNTSKV